jgi:hypothetical protein
MILNQQKNTSPEGAISLGWGNALFLLQTVVLFHQINHFRENRALPYPNDFALSGLLDLWTITS